MNHPTQMDKRRHNDGKLRGKPIYFEFKAQMADCFRFNPEMIFESIRSKETLCAALFAVIRKIRS